MKIAIKNKRINSNWIILFKNKRKFNSNQIFLFKNKQFGQKLKIYSNW